MAIIARYELKLVGIHMHIGSGVDYGHLEQVCDAMVRQVIETGQDIEAISAGGGCRSLIISKKNLLIPATILACGTVRANKSPRIWGMKSNWKSNPDASWWQNPACWWRRSAQSKTWAIVTLCCAMRALMT
ncbi:hypothetical protein RABR111495_24365 [Rahnella bruchi]